ncbi:MAG: hypothetical protein ACC663_06870 [Gammaproteobacteria bacterium]
MYRVVVLVLVAGLSWSTACSASDNFSPVRDAEGNIMPLPRGEFCVAPAEEMRREHMNMLLHQRDKTVKQGIRDKQASLVECINCHVTPDASGKVARSGEKGFFCSACHIPASVKIDCFQCHTDRPADAISQLMLPDLAATAANTLLTLPYTIQNRIDADSGGALP